MIRSLVENVFSSVGKKQKVSTSEDDGVATVISFGEWFPETLLERNIERTNDSVKVLKMKAFPSLEQKRQEYDSILIRSSYNKIYQHMFKNINDHLQQKSGSNIVVTGNPGIGKSRMYLYFIFRFVQDDFSTWPAFTLVINHKKIFHAFVKESKSFVRLRERQVEALMQQSNVIRLIEDDSSELSGWGGISILFTSPGHAKLSKYSKLNPSNYILPVWTLSELKIYNSLLDEMALADVDLFKRYDKYGGIPRFIFSNSDSEATIDALKVKVIDSFHANTILNLVQQVTLLNANYYSHKVLCMVPEQENCHARYHLDFLSADIAYSVIGKMTSDSISAFSEFYLANLNDESSATNTLVGRIYETLCHRWFRRSQFIELSIVSLRDDALNTTIQLSKLKYEMFSVLETITIVEGYCTYYQPRSMNFGALDAFVLDSRNPEEYKFYGLQMTINTSHGIKGAPMKTFMDWMNTQQATSFPKIKFTFYFIFLVSTEVFDGFKQQTFKKKESKDYVNQAQFANVNQYKYCLDVFLNQRQ